MVVATLVLGLKSDSRIKMYYTKTKLTVDQILLAIVADNLQFLAWTKTKDAQKGRYTKKSILKILQGEYEKETDDLASFSTVEEYERYMNQFKE